MRVLMITPSYYPITGGAETVVRKLATKLNIKGIETDVMTFNMNKKWDAQWKVEIVENNGFKVYRIPGLNWFPFKHSDRVTQGVNLIPGSFRTYFQDYDILHFHVGDFTFPIFSLLAKNTKITQFHGPLDNYKNNVLKKIILKKATDFCIGITISMLNDLIELGVPSNKVKYLPNGVDTEVFKPAGPKEKNLVLFVGRITQSKGLHVLLESLSLIQTRVHLVLIGPLDWDSNYMQKIQVQINLENRRGFHKIEYLGSHEEDVIVKWCQKAALLVLPSFREAFGVTILEALSSGTPVVATDIPGIHDAIITGKNGLLVPMDNSKELASSIQFLLDNENIRTSFGKEGRRIVKERFSYDIIIERLSNIYQEIS